MEKYTAQQILEAISEEKKDDKRRHHLLMARLIIAYAIENPGCNFELSTEKFLAAIQEDFIATRSSVYIITGKEEDAPMLLLGSEDYDHDFDEPYIAGIRNRAKKFADITGLEVKRIRESGQHELQASRGPHHIVDLKKIIGNILESLPGNTITDIKTAESSLEALRLSATEKENLRARTEKENALQALAEELEKVIGTRPSIEVTERVYKYLSQSERGRQELAYVYTDNYLIICQFKWDTSCSSGIYCSPSTVTDFAVRETLVINLNSLAFAGFSKESNLFRTTEDGVVGYHYIIKMKSAEKHGNMMTVEFEGTYRIKIELKE